jgi:hypothetical protein
MSNAPNKPLGGHYAIAVEAVYPNDVVFVDPRGFVRKLRMCDGPADKIPLNPELKDIEIMAVDQDGGVHTIDYSAPPGTVKR